MTVPCINFYDFLDYLKAYGWEEVATEYDYFKEHGRLILKKGEEKLYLQYKEKFFYKMVVRMCIDFNVPIIEDHKHNYTQHYGSSDCPCESGKPFVNCHGKEIKATK